jgi:hypothetical protein
MTKVETEIKDLRVEMREGFAGAGETIGQINSLHEERYKEVDQRLAKLEQQAA